MTITESCRALEEMDLRGCGPHIVQDSEIIDKLKSLPRMQNLII